MMIKQEFEDFLDEQLEEKKVETVDFESIKRDWLVNIDHFYSLVSNLLEKYIQSGKISTSYVDYAMNEERLGSYNTKKLLLTLGQQQVEFTPIGRAIFGAQGRIDMEGASGKAMFIFTENNSKDEALSASLIINGKKSPLPTYEDKILLTWKISTPPPGREYIDINEESFFDSLMEVMNG